MIKYRIYTKTGYIETLEKPSVKHEVIEFDPNEGEAERIAQQLRQSIMSEIAQLEAQQTPRMIRCAALGNADDIAKLQEIENQIEVKRKEL